VLGPDADADDSGRNPTQPRKAHEQAERERNGERSGPAAQDRRDDAILDQDLE
jgi:hypothetical protein